MLRPRAGKLRERGPISPVVAVSTVSMKVRRYVNSKAMTLPDPPSQSTRSNIFVSKIANIQVGFFFGDRFPWKCYAGSSQIHILTAIYAPKLPLSKLRVFFGKFLKDRSCSQTTLRTCTTRNVSIALPLQHHIYTFSMQ